MARLDPDFPSLGRIHYHCRYIERLLGLPGNCRNALDWLHTVPTLMARHMINLQELIVAGTD